MISLARSASRYRVASQLGIQIARTMALEGILMSLAEEIDARRRAIKTDGYSMSIGEIMNLYQNKELNINPNFQRMFRWRAEQKTRFIESILLGIPVPSIFVSQREDGVWDVIDGLQRLSTLFEFAGIYCCAQTARR